MFTYISQLLQFLHQWVHIRGHSGLLPAKPQTSQQHVLLTEPVNKLFFNCTL